MKQESVPAAYYFLFGIPQNDHDDQIGSTMVSDYCIPICHVFKFIDFKILLNSIGLVCKRWYLLANFHNGLWLQYCHEYFPRSLNVSADFDQFNDCLSLYYEVCNQVQKQSKLQPHVVQLGYEKIQKKISLLETLGFNSKQCLVMLCYYRFYFAKRFVLERRRAKQEVCTLIFIASYIKLVKLQ